MTAPISSDWILAFIRVIMGVILLYYGWPKIRNLRSNANDFVAMGFRPGLLWGTVIAVVEFFGGLAMLAGLYAELAASLFGFQMIVGTFWKIKIKKGFTDYSYDLQLLALCVTIMNFGAGRLSLALFDATIFLRWSVALAAVVAGCVFAWTRKPTAS